MKLIFTLSQAPEGHQPEAKLGSMPLSTNSTEDILNTPEVLQYKEAVKCLHNEGESLHTVEKYKQAAVKLLLGVQPESKGQ